MLRSAPIASPPADRIAQTNLKSKLIWLGGPFRAAGKLLDCLTRYPMTTLLLSHPACLDHETPAGHPERADRLRAVSEALSKERFNGLVRAEAPEGTLDSVALCHNEHYVTELRHIAPKSGIVYVDGDTSMSPGTWEAVMRAVGGAVAATDAVMSG